MHTAKPGEALKNLRKRNRWTLTDISKKTGIPPSTLSRIENDQISPTYDLLLRLSYCRWRKAPTARKQVPINPDGAASTGATTAK
jgi:transcriptional regulator with XRE-family HTH domain